MKSSVATHSAVRAFDISRWGRRKRLYRFWERWLLTLPYLFILSFLLCLLAWIVPFGVLAMVAILGGFLALSLGVALVFALLEVQSVTILRDVDHRLDHPDLAVTIGDPGLSPAWRALLLYRDGRHLASLDPQRVWPLVSTPLQKVWLAACLGIGGTAILTAAANPPGSENPVLVSGEDTAALEAMIEDWREVAPEVPTEEFRDLLNEVEKLQSELDLARQRPAERIEHLSRIESIVEKHRKAQTDVSLADHAGDLASLLEPVEGLSAASAALRRGDFASAAEALEAQSNSGEIPAQAATEGFQRQAEDLARRAEESGHRDLAETLKKLAEAGKRNESGAWCENAGALGACMSQEASRQLAANLMQAQLDQLLAQKMALSGIDGRQPETLKSRLARSQGDGPSRGLQAGSGSGGDPYGTESAFPQTELETLALTGSYGEGESTVETIRSQEAAGQVTRASTDARFADYQALSEQAVHDESLPLVHRETIRRYFENIRPKASR